MRTAPTRGLPKWSSSEATDENKASLERRYGDCRACAFRAGVPPPKPETIVARLSPKNESEADQRSQLPKLMALYPNSLSSLWIRPRRDPFEARPLTERDRWTGSDLEWQSLVWQCYSPDAHRRSAMPMWDRTPAAASTPAQTLMWDRSTRRRSTKARSWQNGLDDR